MRVLFYSNKCVHSKKILEYLDKYDIKDLFKLVDIHVSEVPKHIDVVPTIVDTELNQPLKGDKAFEYLHKIKYFNNPTNNVEYVSKIPPRPPIEEDKLANNPETQSLSLKESNESKEFYDNTKNMNINKATQLMNEARTKQDKKLSALVRLKK